MKKGMCVAGFVLLFCSMPALAQEWSAEQQEVWKNVLAYSELAAKGDAEGFAQYFHEDFSGWALMTAVPQNREQRVAVVRHFMPRYKTLWYQLQPLAIKIHGNVAVVHYYYAEEIQEAGEKPRMESGRWTDILLKQGNKWVMIADHGGAAPEDD